ncbi:MAG: hypothetical protein AAFY57_16360 [Cyanobacteria bacterium J06642_2]
MKSLRFWRSIGLGAIAWVLWYGAVPPARANPFILFQGTPLGTLPVEQGGLVLGALDADGLPTPTRERGIPGGVTVDTDAAEAIYAGYFNYNPLGNFFINPDFPNLDRQQGFTLEFQVMLDRSTQHRRDRAGLNLIIIGADTYGIELGFESDAIFAQSTAFERAESVIIDTQVAWNYQLTVLGDRYQLFANSELILSGQLRNYLFNPKANQPPLFFNPYMTPGFIFLGDNASSASAAFTLNHLSISK